jgi:hypothetical protein
LEIEDQSTSTASGKSNLVTDLRNNGGADDVIIAPVIAKSTEPTWLASMYASAEASLRRDGVKPAAGAKTSMPIAAILGPDGSGEIEIAAPVAAEGKSDMLIVNRDGKTGLPPLKLRLSSTK